MNLMKNRNKNSANYTMLNSWIIILVIYIQGIINLNILLQNERLDNIQDELVYIYTSNLEYRKYQNTINILHLKALADLSNVDISSDLERLENLNDSK